MHRLICLYLILRVYPKTKEVKRFVELQEDVNALNAHARKMRSRMRATVEQEPISNLSVDALATTQPDLQNRLMRQLSTKNAQDPLQKRPGALQ